MRAKPYGILCPTTHACEVLEPRWTLQILTEMWSGSTRFNEIQRGLGSISPALDEIRVTSNKYSSAFARPDREKK